MRCLNTSGEGRGGCATRCVAVVASNRVVVFFQKDGQLIRTWWTTFIDIQLSFFRTLRLTTEG